MLDEAEGHAEAVRRSERQLRWTLLLMAAMYVVTGVLLSFNPRQGSRLIGTALLITFLVALVLAIYLRWRAKAWSRTALLWFAGKGRRPGLSPTKNGRRAVERPLAALREIASVDWLEPAGGQR